MLALCQIGALTCRSQAPTHSHSERAKLPLSNTAVADFEVACAPTPLGLRETHFRSQFVVAQKKL